MGRYRLLRGKHYTGSSRNADRRMFRPGAIIESDVDLVQSFGTMKFERLSDDPVPEQEKKVEPVAVPPWQQRPNEAEDQFDAMTVAELRQYAADEEIDLGGAARKEEIIRAIRQSRVSTAASEGFSAL